MGLQGKLTKNNIGHTMPVDAPAYNKKAFHFRRAKMYKFTFETSAEAVRELIPENLNAVEPATASLLFCEYTWSTMGPYKEAILAVDVTYKGTPYQYFTHLLLDSGEPILVGRDYYGIPKQRADIEFVAEGGVCGAYVDRPKGIRIASSVFRAEAPMEAPQEVRWPCCSLRTIPNPEDGKTHSLVELIQTDMIITPIEVWSGTGSCDLTGFSTFDPWHKLPVLKMVETSYMVADGILGSSKILETL